MSDSLQTHRLGASVHGILQARILEWVAIPFPSPEDLPFPGIEPGSPAAPELVGGFFTYQFFLIAPSEILLYLTSLKKLKNF